MADDRDLPKSPAAPRNPFARDMAERTEQGTPGIDKTIGYANPNARRGDNSDLYISNTLKNPELRKLTPRDIATQSRGPLTDRDSTLAQFDKDIGQRRFGTTRDYKKQPLTLAADRRLSGGRR